MYLFAFSRKMFGMMVNLAFKGNVGHRPFIPSEETVWESVHCRVLDVITLL